MKSSKGQIIFFCSLLLLLSFCFLLCSLGGDNDVASPVKAPLATTATSVETSSPPHVIPPKAPQKQPPTSNLTFWEILMTPWEWFQYFWHRVKRKTRGFCRQQRKKWGRVDAPSIPLPSPSIPFHPLIIPNGVRVDHHP